MTQQETFKIHGIVLGCLIPEYLDVIVGFGSGLLDGGYVDRIPVGYFPSECRMPNSKLYITIRRQDKQIIKIEPMLETKL